MIGGNTRPDNMDMRLLMSRYCRCWLPAGDDDITPHADGDAVPHRVEPQDGSAGGISGEATATPVDDTTMIVVTLAPTPMTSTAETLTADARRDHHKRQHRGRDDAGGGREPHCALESDLDLAGYPELESVMGCALAPALTEAIGFNEFGSGPDFNSLCSG